MGRAQVLMAVLTATLAVLGAGLSGTTAAAAPMSHPVSQAQSVLELPDGYTAEGMAINQATGTFYADSHVSGDVYAGNLYTGRGRILVRDTMPGEQAYGVAIDGRGRLWVAYGFSGQIRVFDPSTGRRLATYQVGSAAGSSLINDLIVTDQAVYVTDSIAQQMYVVPLPHDGALPVANAGRVVPLTGAIHYSPTGKYNLLFNGNGIATTPDGRALLLDQTNEGKLFRVDPRTGVTTEVRLQGGDIAFADGLHRIGNVLFVAQNDVGRVAEIILNSKATAGVIVAHPLGTRPYARPAALAVFGDRMYVSQMFSLNPYTTPDWIDSFRLGLRLSRS